MPAVIARRGQVLLVMALTMLLIALMVLMTLGFAWRTHQRMEIQIATDAAAYSNAVSTARTFNTISLINRTQVSQMVALAGVQSLISYSGTLLANLDAAVYALWVATIPYAVCCALVEFGCDACACAEPFVMVGEGTQAFNNAKNNAQNSWNSLDKAAAQEAKAIRDAAGLLRDVQVGELGLLLAQVLINSTMTRSILSHANSDLQVPMGSEFLNIDHVNRAIKNPQDKDFLGDIAAVMGSRGSTFVTARDNAFETLSYALTRALQQNCSDCLVAAIPWAGGSGFGQDREQSQTNGGIGTTAAWGDDHGNWVSVLWVPDDGCFPSGGIWEAQDSFVEASSDDGTNQHQYGGGSDSDATIHAMGSCPEGPSPCMWPAFLDYNQDNVADSSKFFGQPVLFALGFRDLTSEPRDPWNLHFQTNVLGTTSQFDNMDPNGTAITQSGFDKQVSLSAAIAYYHRTGHWQEPPNFFNPFWRATLYKPGSDAELLLTTAGDLPQAETTTALNALGFKGGL